MLDEHGAPVLPGEMILPLMFDDDPGLQPLAAAAELLARKDDWGPLYDPERLRRNEVPVLAAVYLDDPYVEAEFSLAAAELIRGTRTWQTNEHQHDGLRVAGVFARLLAMARGEA